MEFDFSNLAGHSTLGGVILYVSVKVIKPLLESFLDGLVNAIKDNTEQVKTLVDRHDRASEHQHAEHKEMIALLNVLTNSLLSFKEDKDNEN